MINLQLNTDDNQIGDYLHICEVFNKRPNRLVIHDTFEGTSFIDKINTISSESLDNDIHFIEMVPSDDKYVINQRILKKISDNIFISFLEIDNEDENYLISEVLFYFKDTEDKLKIEEIIEDLSTSILDFSESVNHKINILSSNNGILDLDSIIIDDIEDIELFYNEDVIKSVNKTIKCLKKQNSGLSIIRGEVGTGKTSLAKYIAQQLDEITIFIPINFIEQSINNPDFRNFLKKYKKVLIVIDDCDFFSFLGKNNYLASNILQLVDGVLSDLISVHVLLVFNIDSDSEIEEIYEDCNCLIDIIEVNYLDGDKSTDLSKHLNHNKKYKLDTKLVDIVKNKKSKNKNLLGLK